MDYAELHVKTNFSFLEGASHPDELVQRAAELGYAALAVTDRNSLAGVVRAHQAAKDAGVKLLVGAELTPGDAAPVVLWAADRAAYGRLARLITVGRRRAEKGQCRLAFDDIAGLAAGLLAGIVADFGDRRPEVEAARYRELFGDRCYLLAELHRGPDDRRRLERLVELSRRSGAAVGRRRRRALSRPRSPGALRRPDGHSLRLHGGGCKRAALSQRPAASAIAGRRGRGVFPRAGGGPPHAGDCRSLRVLARRVALRVSGGVGPAGLHAQRASRPACVGGGGTRYPQGVPERVRRLLEHELLLIEELHYEAYFLTVWDLVRFARRRGILCQGRGSAANSAVCYCLGVTAVDPERMDVLFERFISRERNEAPDIDVDFEHQRREEVLQYLYRKYGRERAGMTAETITYRPRSAIRDLGKALGVPEDRLNALAKRIEHFHHEPDLPRRCREALIDPATPPGSQLVELTGSWSAFPATSRSTPAAWSSPAGRCANWSPSKTPPCPSGPSSNGTRTTSTRWAFSRSIAWRWAC